MIDPVVDEIKRFREEYAARFNYDLRDIFEDARRRQGEEGREVVERPSRTPRVTAPKEVAAS